MHASPSSRNVPRSIGAVLLGLVIVVVLSTAMDALMHGTGAFPPEGTPMAATLWLVATAYRAVFQVLGGYATAAIAPNSPMRHVWVLALIGLVAAIAGVLVSWNMGPEFGPKWYPVGLVLLAIPTVWLGGRLRMRTRS